MVDDFFNSSSWNPSNLVCLVTVICRDLSRDRVGVTVVEFGGSE